MISKIKIVGLGASLLLLQGCTTLGIADNNKFSCTKGAEVKGSSCISVTKVYEETNTKEVLTKKDLKSLL